MERADVERLMRLRWRLVGNRFDDETIDAWHGLLVDVTYLEASQTLERLVRDGHKRIELPDLFAAGMAKRPAAQPRPRRTCPACDGCGWTVWRIDKYGAERYGPCRQCQPDHPWHQLTPDPDLDPEPSEPKGNP